MSQKLMPFADSPVRPTNFDEYTPIKTYQTKSRNLNHVSFRLPQRLQLFETADASKAAHYDEISIPNSMNQRTFENRSLLYRKLQNDQSGVYVTNLPMGAKSMLFKNYNLDLNKKDAESTFDKWQQIQATQPIITQTASSNPVISSLYTGLINDQPAQNLKSNPMDLSLINQASILNHTFLANTLNESLYQGMADLSLNLSMKQPKLLQGITHKEFKIVLKKDKVQDNLEDPFVTSFKDSKKQ